MDADSANERLQVIRTLMERSAIYRRALSPIMLFLGILGVIASFAGAMAQIESAVPFGLYWMSVSAVGLIGAFLLARRQAIDRKSTRLNSSHSQISYAAFCLKKKTTFTALLCPSVR